MEESNLGSDHEEEDDDSETEEGDDNEEEEDTTYSIDSGQGEEEKPSFNVHAIDNFEKFAEGMDDIGSEEEDMSMEEDSEDEMDSEENSEAEEKMVNVSESKDDGMLLTFSKDKVAEEVEKGKAVKNQIG